MMVVLLHVQTEAKALGIPMGAPASEFKKLFEDNIYLYIHQTMPCMVT